MLHTHWSTRRAVTALIGLTVPLRLEPLAWTLAYHPTALLNHLAQVLLTFVGLIALGTLVAAGVFLWGIIRICTQAERVGPLLAMGKASIYLLSFVGGLVWGQAVWRANVERVVERGEPLVRAIHQFTVQNGRPPESLDELTPQYLAALPGTGIGTSPEFHYVLGEPARYDGNPWVLLVHPPCLLMKFDSLMYFPLQNYPVLGHGGVIERVGAWGYVHE